LLRNLDELVEAAGVPTKKAGRPTSAAPGAPATRVRLPEAEDGETPEVDEMAAALAAFSAAGPNASAAASGGAYCRSLGMFMPSCEANAVRKSDGLSMEAVDEFSEEALQEELGRWSAKAPEMV